MAHRLSTLRLVPATVTGFALALLLSYSAVASAAESGSASDKSASERPVVRVQTNLGHFDIELLPKQAPASVANFLARVDDGFYEGLIFHRVISNFMIQAGGYDAALTYRAPPATVVNESANGLRNRKGAVAMARLADPDSADTQFFINTKDNGHLDAKRGQPGYSVFGQVVAGWDTVTKIELVDTGRRNGMAGVPEQPVVIESIQRR